MQGSIKFKGLKVMGRERWGEKMNLSWVKLREDFFTIIILKRRFSSPPPTPPPPRRPPKDHRLVRRLLAQTRSRNFTQAGKGSRNEQIRLEIQLSAGYNFLWKGAP